MIIMYDKLELIFFLNVFSRYSQHRSQSEFCDERREKKEKE